MYPTPLCWFGATPRRVAPGPDIIVMSWLLKNKFWIRRRGALRGRRNNPVEIWRG